MKNFVALATHSGSGGAKGLQAMQMHFQHLGANILARELLTNYDKPLNEEAAIGIIIKLAKLYESE